MALLSACGSTPTPKPEQPVIDEPVPATPEVSHTLERFSPLYAALFYQAEDQLNQHNWQAAQSTLEQIDTQALGIRDFQQWRRLMALVQGLRGHSDQSRQALLSLLGPNTDSDIYLEVLDNLRTQLRLANQPLESAYLGFRASQEHSALMTQALINSIWIDLQATPAKQLQTPADETNTTADDWDGWLALAQLGANERNQSTSDFIAALQQWQNQYPSHPASVFLPGGLDYLMQAPQARSVALLLPLSGRLASAGAAVRDGYLAGYFRDQPATNWNVHLIDTHRYNHIEEAYHAAEQQGADIIIGPLDKDRLRQLAAYPQRALPIIALNRIDTTPVSGGRALVQLALSPQDEAQQLARLAFGKGHRNGMLIYPGNDWGKKMAASLTQQWTSLGGKIPAIASYQNSADMSASIERALGLQDSNKRRQQIARIIGARPEFTPRRRQDIDVVFMLTNTGDQARSIKPLLAFHYAGNLPVMTTSAVYSGPDTHNRDLAGVTLLEFPWLLDNNSTIKDALGEAGNGRLSALYALGADAYLLQTRFAQLAGEQSVRLRGFSGNLQINKQLQIERSLQQAAFDGAGRLKSP